MGSRLWTGQSRVKPASLAFVHEQIVACTRCARLRTYCARVAREKKAAHREDVYWGRPVPGFGDPQARLLILGLAPAAHGANRTGRVFTGDGSGDFLMRALHRTGFANIPTSQSVEDGLALSDAYIAAAVRCAPPDNKPTLEELAACQVHLLAELGQLPRIEVVVTLGRIAYEAWGRILKARGIETRSRPPFRHGAIVELPGATVIASYHPSRQNTNTGRLTASMLEAIFRLARTRIPRPEFRA